MFETIEPAQLITTNYSKIIIHQAISYFPKHLNDVCQNKRYFWHSANHLSQNTPKLSNSFNSGIAFCISPTF